MVCLVFPCSPDLLINQMATTWNTWVNQDGMVVALNGPESRLRVTMFRLQWLFLLWLGIGPGEKATWARTNSTRIQKRGSTYKLVNRSAILSCQVEESHPSCDRTWFSNPRNVDWGSICGPYHTGVPPFSKGQR